MTEEQLFVTLVDSLAAADVPYMLRGSVVSNFYGVPHAEWDLQVTLAPPHFDRFNLMMLSERLGKGFQVDLAEPAIRSRTISHPQQGTTVTFFELDEADAHESEAFSRRRGVRIFDRATFIPTPEDQLVTALRWHQVWESYGDDQTVRGLIAIRGTELDWNYVCSWCGTHDTRDLLERIRADVPVSLGH